MSTESNFSFTTKFNGDLFTVRGNDADEFSTNLKAVLDANLPAKLAAVVEATRAAGIVADKLGGTEVEAPKTTAQPADATGHFCKHGKRTLRSGTGKNGRAWSAYMCAAPQGSADKCEPEWVR